jgi:hypothetical protein
MAAGDVDVRIVNADATLIDTAVTAQRVLCGISGAYMMTSIGPQNQQVVLVAIQQT